MQHQTGLLTGDEAADRLGVSARWVRRAVQERRIPFVKVGRFVRFDAADLDDYLAQQRVPARREGAAR